MQLLSHLDPTRRSGPAQQPISKAQSLEPPKTTSLRRQIHGCTMATLNAFLPPRFASGLCTGTCLGVSKSTVGLPKVLKQATITSYPHPKSRLLSGHPNRHSSRRPLFGQDEVDSTSIWGRWRPRFVCLLELYLGQRITPPSGLLFAAWRRARQQRSRVALYRLTVTMVISYRL